jgi:choline dehydrogenase-like flavoprotein
MKVNRMTSNGNKTNRIILSAGMMPGLGTPEPGKRYMTLLSLLLHGLSRGHVHISSSNPFSPLVIDPQYLSNSADLDMLLSIIKYVRRLANTEPLKSAIVSTVTPDPDANDDELAEHLKKGVDTIYHPTGTASMLPREDNGVVNPRLIVYGTKNLRVVDASVIPIVGSFILFLFLTIL